MIDLGLGHVRLAREVGLDSLGDYGPPAGSEALRTAIAAWEGVSADEVVVTTGGSLALSAALATVPRPGTVLCPRPFYPLYPRLLELLGLGARYYSVADGPDLDEMAAGIEAGCRAILWNFPSNPTGLLPSAALMRKLSKRLAEWDGLIVSDEVYADIVYTGQILPSAVSAFGRDRVVRVRSFSKVWCMAGARLGYAVATPERARAIASAHWTLAMSPPTPGQSYAIRKLSDDPRGTVTRMVERLAVNRARGQRMLAKVPGLRLAPPPAGIFFWLEFPGVTCGSQELSRRCRENGLIVVPGTAFGVYQPCALRVSFALPPPELEEGYVTLAETLSAAIGGPPRSGRSRAASAGHRR